MSRKIMFGKFKGYNEHQRSAVRYSLKGGAFGNIEDLSPDRYDHRQMEIISRGRGENTEYGNIDELDPVEYNAGQMEAVALGRGTRKKHANIDDLKPNEYSVKEMQEISKQRGLEYLTV